MTLQFHISNNKRFERHFIGGDRKVCGSTVGIGVTSSSHLVPLPLVLWSGDPFDLHRVCALLQVSISLRMALYRRKFVSVFLSRFSHFQVMGVSASNSRASST